MTDDQFEDAKAFWQTVGTPMRYDGIEVGDVMLIEDYRYGTKRLRYAVVVAHHKTEDGEHKIEFRQATEAEIAEGHRYTLVAGELT